MLKRFLLASAALIAQPAFAQDAAPVQPDSNIPVIPEFGNGVWQPNAITNRAPYLQGAPAHQVGDAAPDVVGAFRFICEYSWLKTDDPVVYPNQPGKSHLHDGYGASSVNAYSTYEVQRTTLPADPTNPATPATSCQNALNLSGYWNPALLTGLPSNYNTKVFRPDFISVYYKRFPQSSPQCTPGNSQFGGRCIGTLHRIRYVFGYDMRTSTPPTGGIEWKCRNGGQEGTHADNLVDALAACPNKGNWQADLALAAVMQAPPCSNGQLESPNGRSHVAYQTLRNGIPVCPLTHPYRQPAFELGVWWSLVQPGTTTPYPFIDFSGNWSVGKQLGLRLASDVMPGMTEKKPGSTWHADYDEGWDADTKAEWTHNCIDKMLSCSGGDLGNGTGLKEIYPLDYKANVKFSNRPKMANEMSMGTLRAPQ